MSSTVCLKDTITIGFVCVDFNFVGIIFDAATLPTCAIRLPFVTLLRPKATKGIDLMTEAPGIAEPKQLRDLHI